MGDIRRPGEGGDRKPLAFELKPGVATLVRNRRRRWLWVPAFAGTTKSSPDPPADLGGKALVEIEIVGRLRLLAHAFVEPLRVVADQDAPALGLDAVEN